jgi:hypothetical protein
VEVFLFAAEELKVKKEREDNFRVSDSYKQRQRISNKLLLLLSAVGAGKWDAAANLDVLDLDIQVMLNKYVQQQEDITSFDVNSTIAVLCDRGELGLCLAEITDMLPHDTPGSYSWFQKVITAETFEVSCLREHNRNPRLKPMKVTDAVFDDCEPENRPQAQTCC